MTKSILNEKTVKDALLTLEPGGNIVKLWNKFINRSDIDPMQFHFYTSDGSDCEWITYQYLDDAVELILLVNQHC